MAGKGTSPALEQPPSAGPGCRIVAVCMGPGPTQQLALTCWELGREDPGVQLAHLCANYVVGWCSSLQPLFFFPAALEY